MTDVCSFYLFPVTGACFWCNLWYFEVGITWTTVVVRAWSTLTITRALVADSVIKMTVKVGNGVENHRLAKSYCQLSHMTDTYPS